MNRQRSEEDDSPGTAKTDRIATAVRAATDLDRTVATASAASIAGIIVLLLREPFAHWTGALFVIAIASFLWSVRHCVSHLRSTVRLLLVAEALDDETKPALCLEEPDEADYDIYAQLEDLIVRTAASRLLYFVAGIALASLALVIHLWEYAWRGGALVLAYIALVIVVGGAYAARAALRKRHGEKGSGE